MSNIKLFQDKKIRTHWDQDSQKWYFSVIDVIEVLSESNNPRRYWSDLKRKLTKEGFDQLYEMVVQLKLVSTDGKDIVLIVPIYKGFYESFSPFHLLRQNPSKDGWLRWEQSDWKK